jgi:hypothetical protein
MKEPRFFLKIAVVTSSVLFLSGFVAYRAGAFHWLLGNSTRAADEAGSATSNTASPEESSVKVFISSSKSMVISSGESAVTLEEQSAAKKALPSNQRGVPPGTSNRPPAPPK